VTRPARLRHGWLHRAIRISRWSRVVAYACIAFAGLFSLVYPPVAVSEATGPGHIVQIVWSALMTMAAVFCGYGVLTDRWLGEYVGLLPLAFVAAAYGVSAIARGTMGIAGGVFLLGFFWLVLARWQEVALLRAEADREADACYRPGKPG
jgi:hypothetical protein